VSTIPTSDSLRRAHRRLGRRSAGINTALAAMRRGESLHLEYRGGGRPCWSLSNGRTVSAEVASILINSASVVPAGDALFSDLPGQSWKLLGGHQ
jgi:hypothetical protein